MRGMLEGGVMKFAPGMNPKVEPKYLTGEITDRRLL